MTRSPNRKTHQRTSCSRCGKTIARNSQGSLTSWLFRPAECRCEVGSKTTAQRGDKINLTTAAPLDKEQLAQLVMAGSEGLFGARYKILEQIGSGGMGAVYKVIDAATGTTYALKLIASHLAGQRPVVKRLEQEARTAGALNHPNIVAVYDVGRSQDGVPYLIMDYVDGESLEQRLKADLYLDTQETLHLFIQVAEALAYAHKNGVVHRDLKPSNILLSKSGNVDVVKLVDFGIAKVIEKSGVEATKLTQTGELLGSPLYMSPEQCRGDETDARSDMYSVGCMMYEVLSGHPPFRAENPVRVILKHLSEMPRPLNVSGSHSELKSIVMRCLSKSPDDRYASGQELLKDLERVRDGKKLLVPYNDPSRLLRLRDAVFIAIMLLGVPAVAYDAYEIWNLAPHSRRSISAESPKNTDVLLEDSWDYVDLRGQHNFNNAKFSEAREDFEHAAKMLNATEQQRLRSLNKLSILLHIVVDTLSEREVDAEIAKGMLRTGSGYSSAGVRLLADTISQLPMPRKASPHATPSASGSETGSTQKDLQSVHQFGSELLRTSTDLLLLGEAGQVEQLVTTFIKRFENCLGADTTVILELKGVLADALIAQDKPKEARQVIQSALDRLQEEGSSNSLLPQSDRVRLAEIYNKESEPAEAEKVARAVCETLRSLPESAAKKSLYDKCQLVLAEALLAGGQLDEALSTCKGLIDRLRLSASPYVPNLIDKALGLLIRIDGQRQDAKSAQAAFIEAINKVDGLPPLVRACYLDKIGKLYYEEGEHEHGMIIQSEPYLREALRIRQHLLPPQSKAVRQSLVSLLSCDMAENSDKLGLEEEALAWQLVAVLEKTGSDMNRLIWAYTTLVPILLKNDHVAEAKQFINATLVKMASEEFAGPIDERFYATIERLEGKRGLERLQSIFENRVKKIQARQGPSSIKLALAINDLAESYSFTDPEKSKDLVARAAQMITSCKPKEMSKEQRVQAGTVVQKYANYLDGKGEHDWRSFLHQATHAEVHTKSQTEVPSLGRD